MCCRSCWALRVCAVKIAFGERSPMWTKRRPRCGWMCIWTSTRRWSRSMVIRRKRTWATTRKIREGPRMSIRPFCSPAPGSWLSVDVQAGNQTASEYAQPVLRGWLDGRPREEWPALLRGDIVSLHAKAKNAASLPGRICGWLKKLMQPAEQLNTTPSVVSLENHTGELLRKRP